MNNGFGPQGRGRAPQATTFQERVKLRMDKAAQPGAVVIIPKCEGARVLLKIAEQVDDMLDQLYRESSMFGSISDTQKANYEQALVEHSVELSLLAEKLARKLPRSHRYYHPEALRRYIEVHPSKATKASPPKAVKKAKGEVADLSEAPVAGDLMETAPSVETIVVKAVKAVKRPVEVEFVATELPEQRQGDEGLPLPCHGTP